jgi:outer membrane immunogenic protein
MRAGTTALVLAISLASTTVAKAAGWDTPGFSWTGFYVGGNAGVSIGDSDYRARPGGCALSQDPCIEFEPQRVVRGDFDDVNFTGGAQLGYNLQFRRWLVGVETDINFNDFDETDRGRRVLSPPLTGTLTHSVSGSIDWFGTVRGRIGVLASPTLLIFATGGFAYGDTSSATLVRFSAGGDTYSGRTSETSTGWTVGGGGEWAFSQRWTAKLEYLFIDLGDEKYTDKCVRPDDICSVLNAFEPPLGYETDIDFREHVVRVGVNYKFGPAAPPPTLK